jgi:hypothetical protein
MTLVPFTDCCLQLGIDPKTLRGWLKTAHFSPCLHPADARVKCLTSDQLNRLAALHDRRLLLPTEQEPASPLASPALPMLAPDHPAGGASSEVAEVRHQLTLLQAQMATLQAQVTELALVLLRAPGSATQVSPSIPAKRPAPVPSASPQPSRATPAAPGTPGPTRPASFPGPQPPRPQSRALPLIEVRPDGTPVIISPTEGVLPLVPDSPEWFAWLASLKSFSFRCSSGHFHAKHRCAHGKPVQLWNLRLALHGRSCDLYLGSTRNLTLAFLQDAATRLSARLTNR